MLFIVFLLVVLIAFDYMYSISDILTSQINSHIDANPITTMAYNNYGTVRNMLYSLVTGVVVPFLLFLTFTSSFINRNQNIIMYLIQVIGLLMITPIVIYTFGDVLTNMLNITILDTAYMAQIYFTNFMYILVANMLMGLASFVFVQRAAAG
jgi:uncharacterized protein Veg